MAQSSGDPGGVRLLPGGAAAGECVQDAAQPQHTEELRVRRLPGWQTRTGGCECRRAYTGCGREGAAGSGGGVRW